MERIQRQRSNPSSSTQSRSNKFRSNPTTKDDKIPNTNNPDDSTDSAKSRRGHVDDCSNLPALLGTCPFMCPGTYYFTSCLLWICCHLLWICFCLLWLCCCLLWICFCYLWIFCCDNSGWKEPAWASTRFSCVWEVTWKS